MPTKVRTTLQLPELDIRTRQRWRAWLAKHHASSAGVWLVLHKAHTGVEAIAHVDALREALCYGWIDSLVRRLDDDRYAIKFTPRKPASKWSDINRTHWMELDRLGLLAAPGRAAAPTENRYAARPKIPELPRYIAVAFKRNPDAWRRFQSFASSHRRNFVVWIHMAKRPETREKRIRESIALLSAGKKLGLK